MGNRRSARGTGPSPIVSRGATAREPSAEQLQHALSVALSAFEDQDRAANKLHAYYDPTGRYAGSTFLDLPNDPCNLDPTDLYALSTLDVRATPLAGRRLLAPGQHRAEVLAALASPELPAHADLRSATPMTWEAAEVLYKALKSALGENPWVTASKLSARKRPGFFPVRDSVVTERVLGLGQDYWVDWAVYRNLLLNRTLERQVAGAIDAASQRLTVPITDPHLRVIDVVLWATAPKEMRQRRF
jgi:hypothetical protein